MKNLIIAIFMLSAITVFAGNEKATINTSAQCEMCKEKIEGKVASLEGVKKVLLDVDSKELKVKFDNEVTSLSNIKEAIAEIGYVADNYKPTKEAVAALDKCCQPKSSCCASKKSSCSSGK